MRKLAIHALLAAVSAAALHAPAMAQQQGLPPLGAPNMGALQPLPAQNLAPPPRPVAQRPAESSGAAPVPAQPAGGFMVDPPRPDATDPAMRMNLDNARERSAKIQGDGASALNSMTRVNMEQAPVAQLPGAPIVGQGDLESLVKSQRNIRVLNQQVEEAKKATELWHILYNNDDAKQWREREEKVLEAKKKEEEETKKREAMAAASAPPPGLMGMMPGAAGVPGGQANLVNSGQAIASALATMPPVAPKVVEVSGSQALLLVPGKGEVWARSGMTLPGGYKVISVAPKRVEAQGPKGREVLAYGTSVTSPSMPSFPAPMAPRPQIMPASRL